MSGPSAAAPWRQLFPAGHLQDGPGQLHVQHCAQRGDGRRGAHAPRAHRHVPRALGHAAGQRAEPGGAQPGVYESDLPVFTTDARMSKAAELAASAAAEAVWYAAEAQAQWRVRGTAWALGPEPQPVARAAIGARMRRLERDHDDHDDAAEAWSWPREVTAHFGNLSPAMRGTFRNPPPGRRGPRWWATARAWARSCTTYTTRWRAPTSA